MAHRSHRRKQLRPIYGQLLCRDRLGVPDGRIGGHPQVWQGASLQPEAFAKASGPRWVDLLLLDWLYVAQGFLRVCLEECHVDFLIKTQEAGLDIMGCILSSGWLAEENAKKRCHGESLEGALYHAQAYLNHHLGLPHDGVGAGAVAGKLHEYRGARAPHSGVRDEGRPFLLYHPVQVHLDILVPFRPVLMADEAIFQAPFDIGVYPAHQLLIARIGDLPGEMGGVEVNGGDVPPLIKRPHQDLGLRLGSRPLPLVIKIPRHGHVLEALISLPSAGEVAVEVDAVCVLTDVVIVAVGVRYGEDLHEVSPGRQALNAWVFPQNLGEPQKPVGRLPLPAVDASREEEGGRTLVPYGKREHPVTSACFPFFVEMDVRATSAQPPRRVHELIVGQLSGIVPAVSNRTSDDVSDEQIFVDGADRIEKGLGERADVHRHYPPLPDPLLKDDRPSVHRGRGEDGQLVGVGQAHNLPLPELIWGVLYAV